MKLCAVLIPTRLRPDRLQRAVASVFETADERFVEVLLRIDFDDFLTLHKCIELKAAYGDNVRILVGPRKLGYASLHEFYTELSEATLAKWLFFLNDDITIEGKDWHQQLRAIPSTGVYVQPEFYRLGGSGYGSGSCQACPIVPNGCWRSFYRGIPAMVDVYFDKFLTEELHWQKELLRGITINHQRDSDEDLKKHQKL